MLELDLYSGDSFVHRMDPRARVVAAVFYSVTVAVSGRFSALGVAVVFATGLAVAARLPPKQIFSRLLVVNGLIALLWLFLPFTVQGKPLFSLGPLTGTLEGTLFALRITLKSNAIILALIALVSTMSIFTMARALSHLFVPKKIVFLTFFTYRYIHVIFLEYKRLVNAMKIRGFRPGSNMHTYKTYAHLLGMLFVRSYDRAERVMAAMLCRGFNGRFYDLGEFSFGTSDWIYVSAMLTGVMAIGLLQWM